jgi:hypothetical protein
MVGRLHIRQLKEHLASLSTKNIQAPSVRELEVGRHLVNVNS